MARKQKFMGPHDATLATTKIRRAWQVLWSALDKNLLNNMPQGVLLAVSGGTDSRALMEAVATWNGRFKGTIMVASIDHGIRKEGRREAELTGLRAQRLGFMAEIISLNLCGENFGEQDLRQARYESLRYVAKKHGLKTICTAHHQDDDCEGFLMALMGKGGGELGAAMKEAENFGQFIIARPFLNLSKNDLLLALSLSGFKDLVRDSCDEQKLGQRARIRYDLIPQLVKMAPGIKHRVARFAKTQRSQSEIIEKLAESMIDWHPNQAKIDLSQKPKAALMSYIIRLILKRICDNKDLRSCQPTIEKIALECENVSSKDKLEPAGLDPIANRFTLKDLNTKKYLLPGAVVFKGDTEMVVRRL